MDTTAVIYRFNPKQAGSVIGLIQASREPSGRHTRDQVLKRIRDAVKSLGESPDPKATIAVEISRKELGALKLALLELHGRDGVTGGDVAFVRETAEILRIWKRQIVPILDEREASIEAVPDLDDESEELDPETPADGSAGAPE